MSHSGCFENRTCGQDTGCGDPALHLRGATSEQRRICASIRFNEEEDARGPRRRQGFGVTHSPGMTHTPHSMKRKLTAQKSKIQHYYQQDSQYKHQENTRREPGFAFENEIENLPDCHSHNAQRKKTVKGQKQTL